MLDVHGRVVRTRPRTREVLIALVAFAAGFCSSRVGLDPAPVTPPASASDAPVTYNPNWSWSAAKYKIRYPPCTLTSARLFDREAPPAPINPGDSSNLVSKEWVRQVRAETAAVPATAEESAMLRNVPKATSITTANEMIVLVRELLKQPQVESPVYLEFGTGGSTRVAAYLNLSYPTIGVDSSDEWIKELSTVPAVAAAIARRSMQLRFVDIGPQKCFGFPSTTDHMDKWEDYAAVVDAVADIGMKPVAVFVDGRFRVSCILKSFLQFPRGTPVLVHDFWDRPEYYGVLQFAEVLESAERLVKLVARHNMDKTRLLEAIDFYKYRIK